MDISRLSDLLDPTPYPGGRAIATNVDIVVLNDEVTCRLDSPEMSKALRLAVIGLTMLLAGCGLYGEKGFSGKNRLPADRFIEDVDAACGDTNEDLDDDTASLLQADPPANADMKDAIRGYRDALDDLAEELAEHYGPEDLEQQRDTYVDVLERVDDQLKDARDALDDDDTVTFRKRVADAIKALDDAEKSMRAAGFGVCGRPHPEG